MSRARTKRGLMPVGVAVMTIATMMLAACSSTGGSESATGGSSPAQSPTASVEAVAKDDALAQRLPASIAQRGTLVVGSDTTFAPAEFIDTDGKTPVGYDVDLSRAIAEKLGLELDFRSANFDSILPALGSNYDIGASAFYITKERLNAVNMVSYLQGGSTLLVSGGNPEGLNLDNLCGKTIAVQIGSTQQNDLDTFSQKCVSNGQPAIEPIPLQTNTEAITRLSTGGADGVLSGESLLGYAASQSNGALETIPDTYNAGITGIAVSKDDLGFAQLISDTINSLIADGTYQKILESWGQGSSEISDSQVNPETTM